MPPLAICGKQNCQTWIRLVDTQDPNGTTFHNSAHLQPCFCWGGLPATLLWFLFKWPYLWQHREQVSPFWKCCPLLFAYAIALSFSIQTENRQRAPWCSSEGMAHVTQAHLMAKFAPRTCSFSTTLTYLGPHKRQNIINILQLFFLGNAVHTTSHQNSSVLYLNHLLILVTLQTIEARAAHVSFVKEGKLYIHGGYSE